MSLLRRTVLAGLFDPGSKWRLLAAAALAIPLLAQASAAAPPDAGESPTAPPAISAGDAPAVQVYGILDGGVRHINEASKAGAVTQFASGLNTSRLGLRGVEAIDSDLRANFRLESGFNPGTGVQSNSGPLFDRTATLGVDWRAWNLRLGRQEGFGYELAASGETDPLSMALNLPNPASPAAAGSKAPVLGANPLQGLYSYTYGQLRFNNALRLSTGTESWSAGLLYAMGGIAGSPSANTARAGHVGAHLGPAQGEVIYQQALDAHGVHSDLGVIALTWEVDAWKLQAGLHQLRIGAGFDASGLGNGASGTGILGSSTTVATALAGPRQDFHLTIADLGATWLPAPRVPVTLAAYRTHSTGAGDGGSFALVALAKYQFSRLTAVYGEVDHSVSSGMLGAKTTTGGTSELAYMTGISVRF